MMEPPRTAMGPELRAVSIYDAAAVTPNPHFELCFLVAEQKLLTFKADSSIKEAMQTPSQTQILDVLGLSSG